MSEVSTRKTMNFTYTTSVFKEFPDCSYTTAIVYSYMLHKYQMNPEYVESQESISIQSRCSIARTKIAIKWLKDQNLIAISKAKNSKFNENQYVVHDRYGLYSERSNIFNVKHTRPTSVYLFKIVTETLCFLKVGFSAKAEKRPVYYKIATNFECHTVCSSVYPSITDARKVEQEIHNSLSEYREDADVLRKIMSNGFTECYKIEFEDKVKEVFNMLTTPKHTVN